MMASCVAASGLFAYRCRAVFCMALLFVALMCDARTPAFAPFPAKTVLPCRQSHGGLRLRQNVNECNQACVRRCPQMFFCPNKGLRRRSRFAERALNAHSNPDSFSLVLGNRQREEPSDEEGLDVHVVLPCLNEEHVLPATLERLCGFLAKQADWNWRITVVDNGSSDGTSNVTRAFARGEARVALLCLEQRGRGRALRAAWRNDSAAIQSYMDVDLSTDLDSFAALVRTVSAADAEIAIASRAVPGALVRGRSVLRTITSRGLGLLIRSLFWRFRVRDTQCGCKVLSRNAAAQLLQHTRDCEWFFDTELLLRAHAARIAIHERGVLWVDDRDSRVQVLSTSLAMLAGLVRMRFELWGLSLRTASRAVLAIAHEVRVKALRACAECMRTAMKSLDRLRRLFLRAVDKLVTLLARSVPEDTLRIDISGLMRTGMLQSLGLKNFTQQYTPGLEVLAKKCWR